MYLRQLPSASLLLSLVIAGIALPLHVRRQGTPEGGLAQAAQPGRVPLSPDPKFAQFVYDVVSIKPFHHDPAAQQEWYGVRETPDGLQAHDPAISLVFQAFRCEQAGVEKPSGWIINDNYEIEAKMDPEVAAALQKLSTTDQKLAREHMLQIMLRDRFRFAYHTEPREANGFDLVIAKNGPKLKEASDDTHASGGMTVWSPTAAVAEWDGHATKIGSMLGQLSYEEGRPVSDKTGLTGRYDFTLRFVEERAFQASGPDIDNLPGLTTALEQQLGLRLATSKVTKDFIVIDHIERPSGN